jgi:hypothetical protein
MQRVVLNMELSSADAFAIVEDALRSMSNVTLESPPWSQGRHLTVNIDTDDPDVVEIVREITWEYDPEAVQHSLHLADAG